MSLKLAAEQPKQCGTCRFFKRNGETWTSRRGQVVEWGKCGYPNAHRLPEWVYQDPPPMTSDEGTRCAAHEFPSSREAQIQATIERIAEEIVGTKKPPGD